MQIRVVRRAKMIKKLRRPRSSKEDLESIPLILRGSSSARYAQNLSHALRKIQIRKWSMKYLQLGNNF